MFVEIGGVRIGTSIDANMIVSSAGVEGWYSTPATKNSFVVKNADHGAYQSEQHLFAAKTVVLYFHVLGRTRAENVELFNFFNGLAAFPRKLRVSDDGHDTFVESAYFTTTMPANFVDTGGTVLLTAQIPNPVRYANKLQSHILTAGARVGAFQYPVTYPIQYVGSSEGISQTGTVVNSGSIGTAPVIQVQGSHPRGFMLLDSTGKALVFPEPVYAGAPAVVDCVQRTVKIDGANRTRSLTRREWFSIPAGGDLSVTLVGMVDGPIGQAWATLTAREAWI